MEKTDELLAKYMLAETSREENETIDQWIAASDANRKYFSHFKLIWETSKSLKTESQLDPDVAWGEFKTLVAKQPEKGRVFTLNQWIKIAAMWLVVCAAGVLIYLEQVKPDMLSVSTLAEVKSQELPDGSRVTMNRNSAISFPEKFSGDNREMKLDTGEAFFEVKPDRSKPFIIRIKDVTVRVVGTSFNIKKTGGTTEVIVETGIVKVMQGKREVALKPAEKVTVDASAGVFRVEKERDELYKYYRTNKYFANNIPMNRMAAVLSEIFHVQVRVEGAALQAMKLTTVIRTDSLDSALRLIEETLGADVIRKGDQIIIQKRTK